MLEGSEKAGAHRQGDQAGPQKGAPTRAPKAEGDPEPVGASLVAGPEPVGARRTGALERTHGSTEARKATKRAGALERTHRRPCTEDRRPCTEDPSERSYAGSAQTGERRPWFTFAMPTAP